MNYWERLRARAILLLFRPTLWWNRLMHRMRGRRWWDWVDDDVLLGAIPFEREIDQLQRLGIGAVVNMCAEYKGRLKALEAADIKQLWLPTPDFTPPAADDLRRGVEFIQASLADGRKVYVHCKAGRGRSATVVLCYLVVVRGMTPEQAQQHLLTIRPHVNRRIDQRRSVRQFMTDHLRLQNASVPPIEPLADEPPLPLPPPIE